ncbi:MAG: hypothetical protein L0287_10040 [Anaerolineae bacterium]|nr:hypothetical protein [Anaerolineae bacterium]
MFQKMYVEEPDNWQPVEDDQALKELGRYYSNVSELVDCMRLGGRARTPWAFYRWTFGQATTLSLEVTTQV